MAKKITHFSKLSKDQKDSVNELMETSDIKFVDVNSKKGIITQFDGNEYLVILDNLVSK